MENQLAPIDFGTEGKQLTGLELRGKIDELEAMMFEMPEAQIDFEKLTRHYFSNGMYAREITIPKGTLLTGKIHLHEHINVVSKGDISVLTENGIERIKAPATIISKPGTKRVGFTHEETVWTTFHFNPTNEKDPAVLEQLLIAPSHDDFEKLTLAQKELLCHG